MSEKEKRLGQVVRSPNYPYQGPKGEPASAIHFCSCERWCGATGCSTFNVDRTIDPIMVTLLGEPKPRRITDTSEWTLDRLKKLVDIVSCHVAETPNYLSTSTQISLIQQALNDE